MTDLSNAGSMSIEPKDEGGVVSNLINLFVNPTKLAQSIKEKPSILFPYISIGVITLLFFWMVGDIIVKMQLEMIAERNQPAPPADVLRISVIVGGTLAILISPLLIAGLANFFGSFVLGQTASFKKVFSLVLYAELLYVIGFLVHLPLILAKESMLVSLSLAAALPNPDVQSLLYITLSKISVFHIWEFIVVAIGLSVIYQTNRNKGYLLSVLSVGLVVVLHIISVAIGNAFG